MGVKNRKKDIKEVNAPLQPRNYTGSTLGGWIQVYAESPELAEKMIRQELGCPKGDINMKYIGEQPKPQ
jgi:hypothetical protein